MNKQQLLRYVGDTNQLFGMKEYVLTNKKQFLNFTQWKQMGEREYVVGIEPCNCYVGGRLAPRNKDILLPLEPGESRHFDIEVEIVSGLDAIHALEEQIV